MAFRGTTPILLFDVPFDYEDIELAWITFSQGDTIPPKEVLTKTQEDEGVVIGDRLITVVLTQEETLLFSKYGEPSVSVQIRVKLVDGTVDASNIIKFPMKMILKDGVIE